MTTLTPETTTIQMVSLPKEQLDYILSTISELAQAVRMAKKNGFGFVEAEVAQSRDYLNISRSRLYELTAEGHLKVHKMGRTNYYAISDLNELISKGINQ